MTGHVNNMQTATPYAVHVVACDKFKLNPCLKRAKIVKKISFQLRVDTGKNKVRSFNNYFYKL
jgi:hypothetical protein